MEIKRLTVLSSAIAITLGLAACGGGDSSTGASSNKLIAGTISGFGSIHVNGEHILTDVSTSYSVDGQSDDGSGLDVGDEVKICTTVQSDGSLLAAVVISNDELEGLVTSTPTGAPCPATGSLDVLGTTVNYDTDLVLDDNGAGIDTVCSLVAGTSLVEVHGKPGINGINATKIEVKAAVDDTEIKGTVDAIDTNTSTITLKNITVDYSTATVEDLILDSSVIGKLIEVKLNPATFAETAQGSGNWTATAFKLELEDESIEECSNSDGDEAEIEGVITRGLGDDNGTPGDSSDDLAIDQFEINGSDIVQLDAVLAASSSVTAMIIVGEEVEAEGVYDANGILVANKLEAEESGDLEYMGIITDIVEKDTGNTLTSTNFDVNKSYLVTLDGGTATEQNFVVNPLEVTMDDGTDVYGSGFNMTHLLVGSPNVEIQYYVSGTDNMATKLELK
ncbi:MAG: hypothetical protein DIZ77_13105 [endosymbiont of Seepiophila jonesi]|uniref:DUF5666 domain-containing protein n=1 Tax=endosymbiont of Lamellibrachia luymesi TaxID=2200907 RepID=A0A370DJX4_9GAMM|nr:MAG: hypothetical protein DIZ79_16995 [endosymbiont of Lamellibrachia luymesi]RDH90543.1 MAG: hypothetical protein DIZ77_13105 [endosymbiont of Seepiophila jonesi]